MINSWQTITRCGCLRKAWKPPPRDPFYCILNLEASLHSLLSFAWTLTRPTNLICCDKILFSHTQRGYQFLFLDYFIIFRFFFGYFTFLLILTKTILLLLFYYISFHENYFYFFMFRDVPGCSGMFRNVPECSEMFHVPGFIDARFRGTQREYSSKPLKHSIVKRILVFKR